MRRTALKTRNPAAKADAAEQRVMASWAAAPIDDEGRPKRWTAREGGEYRYMRAIPTMPMCLACHGENIAPEVTAAIRAHYPEDQATGFAPGQPGVRHGERGYTGNWADPPNRLYRGT